jgi:phenylacetate-coenzyme A ligase PaaK-like adenylate-forming protein
VLPAHHEIFCKNPAFEDLAARTWAFQVQHNPVVKRFCDLLGKKEQTFIPISFFRDHEMKTGADWEPEMVFQSSGTTGSASSRHLVRDAGMYQESLMAGYRHFYGEEKRTILALLPHYIERGGSSLVYMVNHWMEDFGNPGSGFHLHELDQLRTALEKAINNQEKILLIGVSYALLDFADQGDLALPADAVVMETGGMKGRRKEMIRAELHATLRKAFGVAGIHSEYGMTELLSQAYSVPGPNNPSGKFRCPPWMRVTITDPILPGRTLPPGQTGRINITDLANQHSCAFIRTDDLGRAWADGSFEVLGRLDHAELRGCNLLYA